LKKLSLIILLVFIVVLLILFNRNSEQGFGMPEITTRNILFLPQEVREFAFANVDHLAPTRTVAAGNNIKELNYSLQDWNDFRYQVDDEIYSLDDFEGREAFRGLIVVQGNNILLEDYADGHEEDTTWVSFSVTKSITSMLIGAAIKDGYIESIDDPISDYIIALKGTEYEAVTIRNLLQMSTGIAWNEDYGDPESDVAIAGTYNGERLISYLSGLPRVAAPGALYNYNTAESNLAGELLRSAINVNASSYLEEKIWSPYGMEHDAYWLLSSPNGSETGGCCLNATLRDYARIGLFALDGGILADGTETFAADWMEISTSPSDQNSGYGLSWWLADEEAYYARGIFQQWIYINPNKNLVIATHNNALRANQDEDFRHVQALINALSSQIISLN
jgi:CubicO group peptidase (beta-lactamase class C family)